MKYLKFTIRDYKAISGELVIDVSQKSLLPIIGINESGKTSILGALFAFDNANDDLNDGRHLKSVGNLYKTTNRGEPSVSAEIEVSLEEIKEILADIKASTSVPTEHKSLARKYAAAVKSWKGSLLIKRDLITQKYSIENPELAGVGEFNTYVIDEILGSTPYVLYFDDFRDTVDEEIEIPTDSTHAKGWLAIIQQLFKRTNKDYSVFKLGGMDGLTRQSVLADVCKTLNNTLAKEWEKFTLEEGSRLDVEIQYSLKDGRHLLILVIRESIDGNNRYFGIRDRSKGFYWFFNFVMKLEFNPKVRSMDDRDTIYLLDEPGSYLHSSAQAKLCEKLATLSKNNVVIYCTHTHYLLDPDKIPLNFIKIAQKSGDGSVKLLSLLEYNDDKREKRLAIQPIIDALHIKPFLTDLNHDRICISEGIYDYYVMEMFKPKESSLKILPSVNANSIKYFISIAIAWRLDYVALWDNDDEGRKEHAKAAKFFGEKEAERFLLLPSLKKRKKYILQDLFTGTDLKKIKKELGASANMGFEKTIALLYFSEQREAVLAMISKETKANIDFVHSSIMGKLKA